MKTFVCGRWNRHSSDRPETRTLWQVRNDFEKGKASVDQLGLAEDDLTLRLIRELKTAGVWAITDGSFRWDSVFDIARKIPGCSGFKQLARIPETNHFHRQPVFRMPKRVPHTHRPILLDDLDFAKRKLNTPEQSVRGVCCCLPGPISLARQTIYSDGKSVANAETYAYFARILNREIHCLIENGAGIVRIEEPALTEDPKLLDDFEKIVPTLLEGVAPETVALATWFGNLPDPKRYFALPFNTFFVDFVEGPENLNALQYFPNDKFLVAGVLDARQTHVEDPAAIYEKLRVMLRFVRLPNIAIAPNTDLHFLPWDQAMEKVKALVAIAKNFETSTERTKIVVREKNSNKCELNVMDATPFELVLPHREFPTSTVGSFPQPAALRAARAKLRRGEINESEYRTLATAFLKIWIKIQEELDITVPVGGEFLREDMAAFFGKFFGGKLLDFVPSYENRRYRPVEYTGWILGRNDASLITADFETTQSESDRPVKETITGPATLADWALIRNPHHYGNRQSFKLALARALRVEIEQLKSAGVKILQVDEPALTTKRNELATDLEAIYECIRGIKDMYLILHICYSDFAALDRAFPDILKLPFHQIHMEMANRNYGLLPLIKKHGFGDKDIGLGVLDVHKDRIESVDEIIRGVERILPYFAPHQIWLTPDCGLKERSEKVTVAKLRAMANAAKQCRKKLVTRA